MTRKEQAERFFAETTEMAIKAETPEDRVWYRVVDSILREIKILADRREEGFLSFRHDRPGTPRGDWFWGMIGSQSFALCDIVSALTDGEMRISLLVAGECVGVRVTKKESD